MDGAVCVSPRRGVGPEDPERAKSMAIFSPLSGDGPAQTLGIGYGTGILPTQWGWSA